jgi:GGDEF domain-containing protein
VFLAVRQDAAGAAELPEGNAFAACRILKQNPHVRVFVLVDRGDAYSPEIARFCMADGSVTLDEGEVRDLSMVEGSVFAVRERAPIDELLASLERELASDEGKRSSAIQRILDEQRHDWVLDHLTDKATGLFAAAFASFKLEEEFKRAVRFHQPLSLILLDLGDDALPADPSARDGVLAEAASVFLTACRDIDVLARFTETTFLFLLPGTGPDGAKVLARRMLEELRTRSNHRLSPRAGLATVPAAGIADRGAFLARVEACLRLAQDGRGEGGLCVSCE